MREDRRPPYFTTIEIIRTVANSLNTKLSNKAIDDAVFKTDIDYREINRLISEGIVDPIRQQVDVNFSEFLDDWIENFIAEYLSVVASISMDGLSRADGTPILLKYFFPKYVSTLLHSIHEKVGGPSPTLLLDSKDRAVAVALNWIADHEGGWGQFVQGCTKEQKDRISAWKRGDDLPTLQYIELLQMWSQGPWPEFVNWARVRILLLVARALDWSRKQDLEGIAITAIREAVWSAEAKGDFAGIVRSFQNLKMQQFGQALPLLAYVQQGLRRTIPKKFSDKEQGLKNIRKARKMLGKLDPCATTDCWFDLHEGRWNVFAGNLDRACEYYKKAFDGSLYRSGDNLKELIAESMVVAASLTRPDKVFLKRLKNVAITLDYDISSVASDSMSKKNVASDFIEDWEIGLWKAHFITIFPKEGLFPGTNYPDVTPRLGPLVIMDFDTIKPDYRNPDRRIKVGDTWQKTYPQIVWFAEIEKTDVVEKLIAKGADVNAFSDSKDTAILMALEAINAFSSDSTMDDSLYKLLVECPHKPETLNTRTLKKRLLPLISAVESGKAEVVQKLLEMGADPNLRGKTDEQTPLNVCLKYLGLLKNPEKFWENQAASPLTPEALDSIRRHCGGLAGFALDDQKRFFETANKDQSYKTMRLEFQNQMTRKALEHVSVADLREIALLLLESGADANAEHSAPLPGYTPMMLAAELGETDIFRAMLKHGGDPTKTYIAPRNGQSVNCLAIADYFGADEIADLVRH